MNSGSREYCSSLSEIGKENLVTVCSIPDCGAPVKARGWCGKHWTRWYMHGDPYHERRPLEFWDQVEKSPEPECWIWKGATKGKESQKYGSFYFRGASWLAHRVAWVLTFGEIPELDSADYRGTCVLHRCDNPLCVNPGHLFLGTHQDNMDDKMQKSRDISQKPFCKHGHPRTPENLYTSKVGLRSCRLCHREREARRYAARHAEKIANQVPYRRTLRRMISFRGESKPLLEWCQIFRINPKTAYKRIFLSGWTVDEAFSTPVRYRSDSKTQGAISWL